MAVLRCKPVFAALLLICLYILAGCAGEPVAALPVETGHLEPETVVSVPSTDSVPDPKGGYLLNRMSGIFASFRIQTETAACDVAEDYFYVPWYERSRLIYHAGGEVDGESYTNSREAIEQTLSRGDMILEMDFLFTSDGHLVCLHEWNNFYGMTQPCTLEKFQSLKIFGRFTTITAAEFIGYMREYPDLYLVVDTKEKDPVSVVAELLRLCDYDADVARRFVIQLYDAGVKAEMCGLYAFKDDNFLFTAYIFGPSRVSEIMTLCREEGITVITAPYGAWDKATVARFTENGFLVFEHTLNYTTMTDNALRRGVYGFYTDSLRESDLGFDGEE